MKSKSRTCNTPKPSCERCDNPQQSKCRDNKIKTGKSDKQTCDTDCPYQNEHSNDDGKKKMKKRCNGSTNFGADKICCPAQSSSNINCASSNSKNKQSKSNKITFDLAKNKKNSPKFPPNDDDFSLNCLCTENTDSTCKHKSKDKCSKKKIKLFGRGGDKQKAKQKHCKHCCKNCKTKNVLKIKNAILTHDPPMVFLSPKDMKKAQVQCCKEHAKLNCEKSIKSSKKNKCKSAHRGNAAHHGNACCSSHDESFNALSCPCSSTVGGKKIMSNGNPEEMEDYDSVTFNNGVNEADNDSSCS